MKNLKDKLNRHPDVVGLLLFVLGCFIVVYSVNHFFAVLAPFVVAFVITKIMRPLMVKMKKILKLPNVIGSLVCLLIFASTMVGVAWIAVHYAIESISYVINFLSSKETIGKIVEVAHAVSIKFDDLMKFLNINVNTNELSGVITNFISKIITSLSDFSIDIIVKLPSIILSLVIGCIASFYMLADYDRISDVAKYRLSDKTRYVMSILDTQVLISLIKMALSYALLSVVCFVELLIGFMILGIERATFVAIVIAVLDVLPVIGSGFVLVPWGILSFIIGDPLTGIGVFILWIVIEIVRQILEPKIVGSQIGLHPLVTIMSLYIGLKLMGGIGIIVAPLYVITCKELNKAGVIKLYKKDKNNANSLSGDNEHFDDIDETQSS